LIFRREKIAATSSGGNVSEGFGVVKADFLLDKQSGFFFEKLAQGIGKKKTGLNVAL